MSKTTEMAAEPRPAARSRSDELRCPIRKTRNDSNAESAGDENDENRTATAVMIVSSRKIRNIDGQTDTAICEPPTHSNASENTPPCSSKSAVA